MSDSSSQLWKDRYLIEKELARGGFGIVYLAHDQQLLSKSVVIKEHGTNVHLVNLYSADFGNPALPDKVAAARSGGSVKKKPAPSAPERTMVESASGKRSGSALGIGIGASAVALIAAVLYFGFLGKPPQLGTLPPDSPPPPVEKSAPKVDPPAAAAAPATKVAESAKPPDVEKSPPQTTLVPLPTATVTEQKEADPLINVTAPPTTPAQVAAASGPRQGGGRVGSQSPVPPREMQLRRHAFVLSDRASKATEAVPTLNIPQGPRGAPIRQNLSAAREEFFRLMKEGTEALNAQDYDTAGRDFDLADKEMAKIETVIRRGTAARRQ